MVSSCLETSVAPSTSWWIQVVANSPSHMHWMDMCSILNMVSVMQSVIKRALTTYLSYPSTRHDPSLLETKEQSVISILFFLVQWSMCEHSHLIIMRFLSLCHHIHHAAHQPTATSESILFETHNSFLPISRQCVNNKVASLNDSGTLLIPPMLSMLSRKETRDGNLVAMELNSVLKREADNQCRVTKSCQGVAVMQDALCS